MNIVELLLTALLSFFPVNSPAVRHITPQRTHVIEQATDAAQAYSVPPAILIAVAYKETWLGTCGETDWGAPASAAHRNVAGTPRDAARILARGFVVCRTWLGSAARFRSGDCHGDPTGDAYAHAVIGLVIRMHASTHTPPPENLR